MGEVSHFTHGYTPADLRKLCVEVAIGIRRKGSKFATVEDFGNSTKLVLPSELAGFDSKVLFLT